MAQTYDLTKGKTTPLILTFFFPMLFTNLLQQFYTLADTLIVGQGLGDNALAAVGNMASLTFLIIGFSLGLANGFSVTIAQYYGSGDYVRLRRAVAASIRLSVWIAIALTILSLTFLPTVLRLLQTDASIMADSLTYGYILFGGLAATIAYNLCGCILRALGDSRTPFIAILFSTVLNISLNCLFIFVLRWGVAGAAVATIFSQLLSALICFLKLRRIDILQLTKEDFQCAAERYPELLKNGLPMAFMNSITAIGCMAIQYFVNGLGVAYTSAHSVGSRYLDLFMQPGCTLGFTMSAFVGQNHGAGRYDRIKEGLHVCLLIGLIAYLLLGTAMAYFARPLAGLMLDSEASIAPAAEFLTICGTTLVALNFLFIFRSAVQAMGHPMIPMCSGILEMVLRIVTIALGIAEFGFTATVYATPMAWLGAVLLNFIAFEILYARNAGSVHLHGHKKALQ